MLSEQQKILLDKHLELVLRFNNKVNLTRICSFEEAKLLHIVDSLQILPKLEVDSQKKLIDIGSGAGYPGIPIKICSDLYVDLCETVNKKSDVLNYMISKLNLKNIKVYNERIENVSKVNQCYYDYVTARALSRIVSLLELASPLLKIGGKLFCYKSEKYKEEIEESKPVLNKLGFKLFEIYDVSYDEYDRKIIIFKKIAEPNIKLPRKLGFAQKKPLIF